MAELSAHPAQKSNIEANINGLGNDTILVTYFPLSKLGETDEPVQDTILSDNGRFSYTTPSQEPILLYLFPQKGELKRKSGRGYRPIEKHILVLLKPDDKLAIEGELKEFYLGYQVSGSEFNEQYAHVRSGYIEKKSQAVALELELDSLQSTNADKELINELLEMRNEINGISRAAHLEYIKNNPANELSAFYLASQPLETFGEYLCVLTPEVRNGLFKNALDSKHSTLMKYAKVKEAEFRTKEGEVAPTFVLESLSSVFSLDTTEGEYVVLDFWGSWCPHCIKGIPKMKEYYSKYKGSVEFIGIGCNETEEKWRKAVHNYELPWIQVINTSDTNKDVSVMYGVQSFPTKFILDKNKRIVAKYVGEIGGFYNKLDELMSSNNSQLSRRPRQV